MQACACQCSRTGSPALTELAGAVELDRPYITMLEAGRKQPTLSVLWRIAAGLQLSAGDLATRVDEQLARAKRLRPAERAS
jgi:transcriptional regulator with XRE-family HTH domain